MVGRRRGGGPGTRRAGRGPSNGGCLFVFLFLIPVLIFAITIWRMTTGR